MDEGCLMKKALITTIPFGFYDPTSLNLLHTNAIESTINPFNQKIKESQLKEMIHDYDYLIAGTEPITESVLKNAEKLALIARVGVGYNNIDLDYAKSKNIKITYIPDGPDAAVADLTIGLIYSLLRATHISNLKLHRGEWQRHIGRRIQECKVGIIGAGKIGFRVATELEKIGTKSILLCDLEQNTSLTNHPSMKWADINEVIKSCDVLTFHLPLTSKTENLISEKELLMMKKDAVIVNTSRGGIINEDDLYKVLESGHLFGVALDVFRKEPYSGKLIDIDRCLLTAHTASMTIDCRNYMEIEAVKEVIRHLNGESLKCEIPAI